MKYSEVAAKGFALEGWAECDLPVNAATMVQLFEDAANAQGCSEYAEFETSCLRPDSDASRAFDRVEHLLEAAVRASFPAEEWIVLRSDGPNSCIFRKDAGRGLHTDATSTREFIELCGSRAVRDALRHVDDHVLADAVQPVNMWI